MSPGAYTWAEVRVGDLGAVVTGRTPSSERPSYFGELYPFITPGDMRQGRYARKTARSLSREGAVLLKRIELPANSICVSCIGWQMGEVIITDKVSFSNQQINAIIPKESFDPSFLYYSFKLRKQELLSLGSAAGVRTPILNKSAFCSLKIAVPPLSIQRRIASIVGAYDDLIEVNQQRIALLEEMARRLFEEWFVRFRFPGHEAQITVETSGGTLPPGWALGTLSTTAEFVRGRSYRSADLVAVGGVPFVNLKCFLRDGGFKESGLKRYAGLYNPNQLLMAGDIVMAVTDMTQERRIVGQAARVPRLDEFPAVHSMDLVKIMPLAGMSNEFLYHWLRFSDFSSKAAQRANGANVLHLAPSAIADFPIIIPPQSLQTSFARQVVPNNNQCDALQASCKRLAASRDLLLPRLISGELSISTAERELEDVA
jgi:type I restriction enzyme, S subunit